MTNKIYMLDTCICSFIMREHPEEVLLRLQQAVSKQNRIVISSVTYAEMMFGSVGKKASPKHKNMVKEFVSRIDEILPWDRDAVDATTKIRSDLSAQGMPIGANDSAIAGHAISSGCVLVTNNVREFSRVDGLIYEDWVH